MTDEHLEAERHRRTLERIAADIGVRAVTRLEELPLSVYRRMTPTQRRIVDEAGNVKSGNQSSP